MNDLSRLVEQFQFQSTPSARRATVMTDREYRVSDISIHALREESDYCGQSCPRYQRDFNPRPPRGERPITAAPMC